MTTLASYLVAASFFGFWSCSLFLERAVGLRGKSVIFYLKTVVTLSLLVVAGWPLLDGDASEYRSVFVDFAPDSMRQPFVEIAAAVTLSWYTFEAVVVSQRDRVDWSAVVHHWMTALAAGIVLMGRPHPVAILYGVAMVSFAFPIPALFAARSHLTERFPGAMRRAHVWVWYYYAVLLASCLGCQLVLLTYGLSVGQFSPGYGMALLLFFGAWVRDDLLLLSHLDKCSRGPRVSPLEVPGAVGTAIPDLAI